MGMIASNLNVFLNRHSKSKTSMMVTARPKIHPPFFPDAQVFCGGEVVMTVGGAKEKYVVDIWSGNHPFFQGANNVVVVDEGQVNRFKKRFAGLETLSLIQKSSNSEN